MLKYLQSVLGEEAVEKCKAKAVNLPVYLKRYSYERFKIYGQSYVFVVPTGKVNLKSYNVQRFNIEKLFGMPAVLIANGLTSRQKHNLIENRVMFVAENEQLFMPAVGLVLGKEKKEGKTLQSFTPQTQLCSLFFIYMANKAYAAKEISAKLKINPMAVSRGVTVLEELNIIAATNKARQKFYSRRVDIRQYIDTVKPLLISPIAEEVITKKELLPYSVKAGYTALSEYSDLVDDDTPTYAVFKKDFALNSEQFAYESDNLILDDSYVKVQLWKYDPVIFEKDGRVDRLSLLLSFGETDERTEAAIESLWEDLYGNV